MSVIQLSDPFSVLIQNLLLWWQLYSWRVIPIIGAIIVWAFLLIMFGVIRRTLRKRAIRAGLPPDAINGVNIAIGLAFIYIAFLAFFYALPDVFTYMVGALGASSLIIGAAIGLAIGQAVRNLVSGLYVIVSRPFHVEDYVRIGTIEGIVKEISMNYTRLRQPDGSDILVPNNAVLDSDVTNFMYEKQKLQTELDEVPKSDTKRKSVLRRVSRIIETEKVVRYVFPMSFHTSQDLRKLRTALDQVCDQWATKFGFRPFYEINEVAQFSFSYNFILFADKAKKILELKPIFIDSVLDALFLTPESQQ